jgi:alkylation response protein AidB-like acyl-CoA dehydrogenase
VTTDATLVPHLLDTTTRLLTATPSAAVPSALEELGWYGLWQEDPQSAARALFGQQGRLPRTSPMLSLLVGAVLMAGRHHADRPIPALLPILSSGVDGWVRRGGDGVMAAMAQADALAGSSAAVLPVAWGDHAEIIRVDIGELRRDRCAGLDPDLGLCSVDAAWAVSTGEVVAAGREAGELSEEALALGRRLLAEEMSGVASAEFHLALDHSRSRTQFGRIIGSYQAVKHNLADVLVAIETARLATAAAWGEQDQTAALMAKLHAGHAVEVANRNCQQVLAGIGFTWEHPFHRYYRRGRLLDALLGSTRQLIKVIGNDIVTHKALPPTVQL